MVDLGCRHGNLTLFYNDEVPIEHVNQYIELTAKGSDSNVTSCFELKSIR